MSHPNSQQVPPNLTQTVVLVPNLSLSGSHVPPYPSQAPPPPSNSQHSFLCPTLIPPKFPHPQVNLNGDYVNNSQHVISLRSPMSHPNSQQVPLNLTQTVLVLAIPNISLSGPHVPPQAPPK